MARIFKIIINKNLLEILNTLFIITIFKQTFISLVVFNSHKHYTILLTLHCQSLFKYFYIYIYIFSPKPKSKEKTNSKTIQPFLQSKTSNSSTRSIPRLREEKKKRKFQKLVKKKKNSRQIICLWR